jgi:hypothetical protein
VCEGALMGRKADLREMNAYQEYSRCARRVPEDFEAFPDCGIVFWLRFGSADWLPVCCDCLQVAHT